MSVRVVKNCAQLNAEILNDILSEELPSSAESVRVESLGEGVGLMAEIARARVKLTGSVDPYNLIVKCAAQNDNKVAAQVLDFYGNEVNFYRYLAAASPLQAPRCLYGEIDTDSYDFLLILEDLGVADTSKQLDGLDESEVMLAMQRLGEMHGQYWNKVRSEAPELSWLHPHNVLALNEFKRDNILLPGVAKSIDTLPELFEGGMAEVATSIAHQFPDLFDQAMSGDETLIHGDFRADNTFFVEGDSGTRLLAVDWQNCGIAKGVYDVAYLLAGSVEAELRKSMEMSALETYHQTLVGAGVTGYSFDTCFKDYQFCLLISLIVPIAVCGALEAGNERGLDMGKTLLTRNLCAIRDLDCQSLLK